jgi:hypothetical protein
MTEYRDPEERILETIVQLSYDAGSRSGSRGIAMRRVYHHLSLPWDRSEADRLLKILGSRGSVVSAVNRDGDVRVWPMPAALFAHNRQQRRTGKPRKS